MGNCARGRSPLAGGAAVFAAWGEHSRPGFPWGNGKGERDSIPCCRRLLFCHAGLAFGSFLFRKTNISVDLLLAAAKKFWLRHPRLPRFYPHSVWAQWARCKLVSDFKPRSITMMTDPGCWGCYLVGDLRWISALRAVTRTGRWMWLRKLQDRLVCHQLIRFASCSFQSCAYIGSLSRPLFRCGWLHMPQRLIDVAACPQPMEQHGQLACHSYCCSFFGILPAALA
jgi:hypothetical protein